MGTFANNEDPDEMQQKTQMKCSIMLHFIRVYTVCKGEKDLQTKECNIFRKL